MKDKIDDAITIICFVIAGIMLVVLVERTKQLEIKVDAMQMVIELHGEMMKAEGIEYR